MFYGATKLPRNFEFKLINLLRGTLALTILIAHYSHFYSITPDLMDSRFQNTQQPFYNVLKIFYLNSGAAVRIFWVVSGFVLAHQYLNRDCNAKYFFIARFARLYPLHLLTLVIVGILQFYSQVRFKNTQIYGNNDTWHFILNFFTISNLGLESGHSYNAPFWSVSCEIIAYIIFGLTFKYYTKIPILPSLILFCTTFFIFFEFNILTSLVTHAIFYFYLGVVTYQIFLHRNIFIYILSVLIISLFILAKLTNIVFLDFTNFLKLEYSDFYNCLVYASVILLMCSIDTRFKTFPFETFSSYVGNLTYSTYLMHVPYQIFLLIVLQSFDVDQFLLAQNKWFFIFYLISIIYLSRIIYLFFEHPIRFKIRKIFHKNIK